VSRSTRKRRPQRTAQRSANAPTESSSLQSSDGFGLNDAIALASAEEKYAIPTPIQVQTIPMVGDRVTIEVSPYDLDKGRLIFRHKDERPGSGARPVQRNHFRWR
jgi:hypothetical protein